VLGLPAGPPAAPGRPHRAHGASLSRPGAAGHKRDTGGPAARGAIPPAAPGSLAGPARPGAADLGVALHLHVAGLVHPQLLLLHLAADRLGAADLPLADGHLLLRHRLLAHVHPLLLDRDADL